MYVACFLIAHYVFIYDAKLYDDLGQNIINASCLIDRTRFV